MDRQRVVNRIAWEHGILPPSATIEDVEPDLGVRAELAALLSSGPVRRAVEDLLTSLPDGISDVHVGDDTLRDRLWSVHDKARVAMVRLCLVGLQDGRHALRPLADIVRPELWPSGPEEDA